MPIEKIVVVEDDVIVRKNLEQQLRRHRYDVAAVGTLAAAREYLAKDSFDLVFADVRLPDGEGTDLLRELQARPEKPLVVIMTGFGTPDFAVSACARGPLITSLSRLRRSRLISRCARRRNSRTWSRSTPI